MHSLCFIELQVTVNNVKIMVITQCFYGDFMQPTAMNYFGLYVKCLIFCPILTKFGFCNQMNIKVSSIKLHRNPSNGSRADICRQTDGNDKIIRRFPCIGERAQKFSIYFRSPMTSNDFIY